jgi:hypothetical protein
LSTNLLKLSLEIGNPLVTRFKLSLESGVRIRYDRRWGDRKRCVLWPLQGRSLRYTAGWIALNHRGRCLLDAHRRFFLNLLLLDDR